MTDEYPEPDLKQVEDEELLDKFKDQFIDSMKEELKKQGVEDMPDFEKLFEEQKFNIKVWTGSEEQQ